ncbi:hypothetical protein WL77_15015 [Burkholderia ubonensis]|uniref:hypothetical protein n=1 Tax=Burkholderia ubonensis TaxID=101571 RepID=UPI00075F5200|nr:hypothetical protein [Burkholderia ubonensis]KWE66104.1 hypothetical protein WL79_28580 [Burkholderia ubonensis]KWE67314.1 hypothetical protein WL77_15015 [Burkholderia ubonensis]
MNNYLFGISVLAMLLSAGAGLARGAAAALQLVNVRSRLAALSIGAAVLLALMVVLAWSVPPRG